jgi:hypothetical protein
MWRRARAPARNEDISPSDLAWLLLLPSVAVATVLVLLLAEPLGNLLFPRPALTFWSGTPIVRKPAIQAGYPLAVVSALLYAALIVAVARRKPTLSPRKRVVTVVAVQLLGIGLVVACWIAQRDIESVGAQGVYFTTATVVVAAFLTLLATAALVVRGRWPARRPIDLAATGVSGVLCAGAALLATGIWALAAVYTDAGLTSAPSALFLGAYFFDESSAVLNGRSPLVNMATYGSLWSYLVSVPLRAFGGTYAAFTTTMATITAAALMALYGTLVVVTRRAVMALALYLPILATAFFIEEGTLVSRYSPGTYYGMFPLRYAGPSLLALLTAAYLRRASRHRAVTVGLFAICGLVVLNNLDFGGGALLGTLAAVIATRQPADRRSLARLGVDVLLGLACAVALVSMLLLLREGTLPQLGWLTRYGTIFVTGGKGNLPLPDLGLHVVITATFVASVAVAAVRMASGIRDELTGMLAWAGAFGLCAGIYYYAYRSHPDVLVNLFPAWTLALALLVVAVFRASMARNWRVDVPAVAVLFGFALAACSIAQMPTPWSQARRIAGHLEPDAAPSFPAGAFRQAEVTRLVARRTRKGERVVILSPVGHRVAREAGVVNVSPYTGLGQMPTRDQLEETLTILADEGGRKLFLAEIAPFQLELETMLVERGYRRAESWTVEAWPSTTVIEFLGRAPREGA